MGHLLMNTYQKPKDKVILKNIKKSFGEIKVLDNLTLNIKENEFVSILGLSGCGKSTIFNLISGIYLPNEGEIFIDDKLSNGVTGRVSYMHQKDLLFPWRTIIDNVILPLIIKGIPKKRAYEMVKDYFSVFGLEGFHNKYPNQLSGGMRQRVALLRTYMFSQDIFLLDEPFSGLDAITKSKMHEWLINILENLKVTVLFITHDIEEAILLSDRVYILSNRPARIKKEFNIDIKKPRRNDMITSNKFNNLKKMILEQL